ncbi:hypothetical protein A3A71_00470 [Candidatus Berkelbacteria bacterium RIFCSPLOWO2_01_FULL_50_28]|uniref:Uncharacterized protein n=1 Tax=Candidatus Berkelbacteria bacterium RIFCSPLOWO2_01_FULL_50_28 TaxID=1797471 RepID=A0A1F5EAU0_9BACT|nr:MAG: hypothetical protein A2807_01220 [Candidatus Berkelbacteria bacterium RIFCSPHIGHO2_01_FULL_50_36]OGD62341.1 MAG: hypothetical protein A3F39_02680 [Candidatus Berkelbacteria bacterium RIFCSPHIGHO2_12_FULL_50_11]OGD64519.1 MAG: hypothetical protein A3A71_00470 [Candidatus Berkelbacteria bacterium RIFCSPLOWO2_01_FULL_50_28]
MSKKLIFVIGGLVAIGALLFAWFSQRGTLEVVLGQESKIKNGVEFSLSNDKFRQTRTLPATLKMSPGKYTLYAYGKDSDVFRREFSIVAGDKTSIEVLLGNNPNQALIDSTTDFNNAESIPYYTLFPYDGGDFAIEATPDFGDKRISKITITVFHRFAPPSDAEMYTSERDIGVKAAKKWLQKNQVPSSIPIEIIDN